MSFKILDEIQAERTNKELANQSSVLRKIILFFIAIYIVHF